MAWSFPVARYLWAGLKALGSAAAKVFSWAWKKPDAAIAVGFGMVAFSWLANSFGWHRVSEWSSAFGWTLVSVGATSAAIPGVGDVVDAVGTWWGDVQKLFGYGTVTGF